MSDTQPLMVNPLAAWLKARPNLRHIDFAKKVGRREGTVTRWCLGTRHPRPVDQARIEIATGNAVRAADWHTYYLATHPQESQAA